MSSKKGFVYPVSDTNLSSKVNQLNVKWFYDWNTANPNICKTFTPMLWSGKNMLNLSPLETCNGDGNLLCFNEPDNIKQANMTVDEVISHWNDLMNLGLRLGSPATATNASTINSWFYNFMSKINDLGYNVDFIAIHWYAPPNPSSLLNIIDTLWTRYKKPIWITEFAPADWTAKTTGVNKYTQDDVIKFINAVIPELEKRDYVERYAWKTRDISDPCLSCSAIFDANGNLTPVGKLYASL